MSENKFGIVRKNVILCNVRGRHDQIPAVMADPGTGGYTLPNIKKESTYTSEINLEIKNIIPIFASR